MSNTPHDALFKSVFQHPENVVAELQHVLAPEHVSAIDWSTLKLESGSFIDEKFANEHSDLLFSASAQATGERVYVYLLFEHQSTAEPKMALRLLSYMVRIWERFSDGDNKAPLPLIVPAVLAQVPGGWNAATRFSGLFSPDLGALADLALPDFTYAVDDLHRTEDNDLRRRAVALQARLALWLMRDARDSALLLQRLVEWAAELEELARRPGGERALAPLLVYVATVSPFLRFSGPATGAVPCHPQGASARRGVHHDDHRRTASSRRRSTRRSPRRSPRDAPRASCVAACDPRSAGVPGDGRGPQSRRGVLRRRCSSGLDEPCRCG